MTEIYINSIKKEYTSVFYADSELGLDTNNGTKEFPFKTVKKAVDYIQTLSSNNYAIVVKGLHEGAVDNSGYIYTAKNIDFIGKTTNNKLPIIRSTDRNTIRAFANYVTLNFYQIQIESFGGSSSGYTNSYALMVNTGYGGESASLTYSNNTFNFYNCYIKPRGVIFISSNSSEVVFSNCIIDYGGHVFSSELNTASSVNSILFENCIELGSYTTRTSQSPPPMIFNNGIYTGEKTFTQYTDSILAENAEIDDRYRIIVPAGGFINSLYGIRSGIYALSNEKILIKSNVRVYNTDNYQELVDVTSQIADPNNITEDEFKALGFDDLSKAILTSTKSSIPMTSNVLGSGKVFSGNVNSIIWNRMISQLEVK